MPGSADNVVRRVSFSLEQQVGLADGIGFGIDFLPIEVDGYLFAALFGQTLQRFLGDGQHSTGAAGAVIKQVCAGFDLVGNGQKDQPGHQINGIARRPVLTSFFVVFFIQATHQLLENRAHCMIIQPRVFIEPSPLRTGLGLRLIFGERSFSMSVPSTSALESRGI